MAWDMIETTKGVTDAERATARSRVLARAKSLGMDTKKWQKIAAMSFELVSLSAMSLEVPETADHPNKLEFSGVLTKVDEPSNLAPHGSYGKKIFIPRDVAEKALPTILGMAVDYKTDLTGHNRQKKIGIITAATVEGSDVCISGFFYANDFPDEVSMIQSNKEDLGFSFEAERILVSSLEQDPLRIESMVFTGAAILQKKSAAYQFTSLAAEAASEKSMEKEQYDAIMAAIGDVGGRVKKLEENDKTRLEAASVADKVVTHADKLHGVAKDMEAAGIGCDPTSGHAHILHHMADSMMAEAHQGKVPSSYRHLSMYGSAKDAPALRVDAAAEEARVKEIKELKDGLASAQTIIKDLQAAAQKSGAPDRKTLPGRISSLMAKGQLTPPTDGGKFTITAIDAALKGTSLTPQERIEVKTGLNRAGMIEGTNAA
jgi:hypothetical protein